MTLLIGDTSRKIGWVRVEVRKMILFLRVLKRKESSFSRTGTRIDMSRDFLFRL